MNFEDFQDVCLCGFPIFENSLAISITRDANKARTHIEQAIKAKAKAILTNFYFPEYENDIEQHQKDDVKEFIKINAINNRSAFNGVIIAVTGSVGKTTTRSFLSTILAQYAPTMYTGRSLNTDIGIWSQMLLMNNKYKYFVIEIGIIELGEMDQLASIVLPDYSIITKISEEHMEYLKSMENIIVEESKIINYTKYNVIMDQDTYKQILYREKCIAIDINDELLNNQLLNNLNIEKTHMGNLILVLGLMKLLGITINSLDNIYPMCFRGNIIRTPKHIIHDFSYNCQPASIINTIENIKEECDFIWSRMVDLGDTYETRHEEIATLLEQNKYIKKVYVWHVEERFFKSKFVALDINSLEAINKVVYLQGPSKKEYNLLNVVCKLISGSSKNYINL